MTTISVVATFIPKEGQENAVEAILRGMVKPTRHEPGCLRYELYGAAGPQPQRSISNICGVGNKGLLQIQTILVDRCQSALSGCEITLELHKRLQPTPAQICMGFQPADDIFLRLGAMDAKIHGIIGLKALSKPRAQ